MDVFRNLTGIQKGLLGGLILGVLVVYMCLCLSAVGVLPIIPQVRLVQPVAQAQTSTPLPPTATSMSSVLPDQPSPTVSAETPVAEQTPTDVPPMPTSTVPPPTVVVLATDTPAPTQTPVIIVVTSPPEADSPTQALAARPLVSSSEALGARLSASSSGLATSQETTSAEGAGGGDALAVPLKAEGAPGPTSMQSGALARLAAASAKEPMRQAPQKVVAQSAPAPQTAATPEWTWQGIEYERRPGAATGSLNGVLAVRIVGVPDRKVFIREASGGWETNLVTGNKPQYGDFSTDVGGLPPGTYSVKPMDIDSEVQVKLDRGDFVLVEFALRPPPGWAPGPAQEAPAATAAVPPAATARTVAQVAPTVQPAGGIAPTPTEQGGWVWQGTEYERRPGAATGSLNGVLAVRVVGVPDRKVFVREDSGGWNATLLTGNKPEYGDFSDDVGGLPPGTYTVKPLDIDSEVQVKLDRGDFVLVEFSLRPPAGATPPPFEAATPKATARVALTAPPPPPALTQAASTPAGGVAPTPTEQGGWVWQGVEYERKPGVQTGAPVGILAVRVVGVPDRKVFVRENSGGWNATLLTGNKPEYGDFSDDVGGLAPGTYSVKPLDIDSEVQVRLDRGDFVLVEFSLRPPSSSTPPPVQVATSPAPAQVAPAAPPPPPAPTQAAAVAASPTEETQWTWQGIEYERKSGAQTGAPVGILAVRVVGVPDRKVFVRENSGGWNATLLTGRKPEYGDFSDDVGGLAPGTYTVKPMDIDSEVQVKLDRGDFVLLEFALRPAPGWTPPPAQATTSAASQAAAVAPAPAVAAAPAATLVPGWTWIGSEIDRKPVHTGTPSGVLIVRAVALPDRQVIVREVPGGWTTTAQTGSKLEGGAFAVSIDGLAPGTYAIRLADVPSETRVKLEAGEQVTVQFNPQSAATQ